MDTDKATLRAYFSTLRQQTPDKTQADDRILSKLVGHPLIRQADTICCYVSYHEEVDTHRFISWALSTSKTICIPKVVASELKLYSIRSLDECRPGYKGILEPPASALLVKPESVEVFVVLGLAFDTSGFRLGYGKGFTDRLLSGLSSHSIGISYTDQVVYELPRTDYDVPVHEVITDSVSFTI